MGWASTEGDGRSNALELCSTDSQRASAVAPIQCPNAHIQKVVIGVILRQCLILRAGFQAEPHMPSALMEYRVPLLNMPGHWGPLAPCLGDLYCGLGVPYGASCWRTRASGHHYA